MGAKEREVLRLLKRAGKAFLSMAKRKNTLYDPK
jgi:hypothetical protein